MKHRAEVVKATRIVVKVGSSSLTQRGRIDLERLRLLVDAIAARRVEGTEVVLVSSGAIAADWPLGLRSRPRDLATQQAAASVGQGLLMARYSDAFAAHGLRVGQVLLTVDDVTRRSHYRNAYRTRCAVARVGRRTDRERERHGGHDRDPLRRQRPAGCADRSPGAR